MATSNVDDEVGEDRTVWRGKSLGDVTRASYKVAQRKGEADSQQPWAALSPEQQQSWLTLTRSVLAALAD